jgi:large subunit ribosomal protein L6
MSRIGKNPIKLPQGVTAAINGNTVAIKGAKGEMSVTIRPELAVSLADGVLTVSVKKETKETNAYWGLSRALLANAVKGVSEEFVKKLELVGVGYRAKMDGTNLTLTLGFSHPVVIPAPKGIKFETPDVQNIIITGFDKQLVGLTAAQIRKLRKPEPYKGKGIRYSGEIVRRKAGKSGKA